jgi:hypothetical protein
MTLARPPIVSQTEWDAALAAMTERERTVAAEMHELADQAAPSASFGARPAFTSAGV